MAVPTLGPKHKLGSVWNEGRKYHSQLPSRKPAPWAGQAPARTKEASQKKAAEERQEFLPCPAPVYPSSASPVNKEQTFKLTMICAIFPNICLTFLSVKIVNKLYIYLNE